VLRHLSRDLERAQAGRPAAPHAQAAE
jgi:hypothetical protein